MENTHYILIKGGVLCLQHSEQFSKAMEPATYINDLSNPSKSILTSLERNNGDWNGFFSPEGGGVRAHTAGACL